MEKTKLDLKELPNTVIHLFPDLNKDEQRAAVLLYRLLARGQPVSAEMIA